MPSDLYHNIVAAKATGEVRYLQVYAELFGFESGVYGFGRWTVFLEGAWRRIGMLLWSMYVDYGALVEPAESVTAAQSLVDTIFELLSIQCLRTSAQLWLRTAISPVWYTISRKPP